MITFTVQAPFRTLFRQHQRFAYAAFFAATSGIMKKLASEQTWFPGDVPGFFGVLHTRGRQLQYHPHIHYVVPGGAFSSEDHSRHPCRKAFYLPVRVAAKLVKHRMYTALKRNGLLSSVDAAAWSQDWNVNSQPAGSGERSIRYLASYVFRTAISDSRIVAIEDTTTSSFATLIQPLGLRSCCAFRHLSFNRNRQSFPINKKRYCRSGLLEHWIESTVKVDSILEVIKQSPLF
ncbi:transposase [Marispirochaeta sp.]|uniref:IS91 family transposase n=1 Tax=Marispirochaeta sp. TaxID=2038653 RepID=UPI0029C934F8|nr:transposase [Marispirochaeta sp.]